MLVMIKAILYERTVAACASMDFWKQHSYTNSRYFILLCLQETFKNLRI